MERRLFFDRAGALHIISPCPPVQLEVFTELLGRALTKIGRQDPEMVYVYDREVAQIVDCCLKLAGVEPDWCGPDDVVRLLFSDDGLITLNQPPPRECTGRLLTIAEYTVELIAALVATEGSLEKALKLAETVPKELLEAVIDARARQGRAGQPGQEPTLEEIAKDLGGQDVF